MKNFTYSLRIRLLRGEPYFGPGVLEIMRLVEKTGSLHTAAAEMGMSYSKAWRIMKNAEEALGYPLTTRRVGGVGGGSSELTEGGRAFMERYAAFSEELRAQADALYQKHFAELGADGDDKTSGGVASGVD